MSMQQYCLRWNNHQPNFISVFSSLLNSESLVDVTLGAEGRHLQAHKVVLSACSSYFQSLFTVNPCQHPIVILKDVKFADLKVMVDFMYYGEVNVSQDQLPYILKTAEMLKIKGLAEIPVDQSVAKHNNNADRAELLTPGESNWSSEGGPRQSMSPSPCPLSPTSKRKRLRKSSTGSGSGSTERTSEEQQSSSGEVLMTTTVGNVLGTVIKSDPGSFTSDGSSTPQKLKQHSSDSEILRASSHESTEDDSTHQITLVPQQQEINITHSVESTSMDMPSASNNSHTSQPQQSIPGIQWNVMQSSYHAAHYTATAAAAAAAAAATITPSSSTSIQNSNTSSVVSQCMPNNNHNQQQQQQPPPPATTPMNPPPSPHPNGCYPNPLAATSPMMKRKRNANPQADENFIRALEAVRFGGIGFCKAARMYGVNNRTLWLEYKKRGYPNFRLSIKNRKQENQSQSDDMSNHPPCSTPAPSNEPKQEMESVLCTSSNHHPVALISSTYFDGKHVDLAPVLQRPKYLDAAIINSQQTINFQGMNFEQM